MTDDEEIRARDQATVAKALRDLMGAFDAVQVFVSRHEGDSKTICFVVGEGNCYARYGQVRLWTDAFEENGLGNPMEDEDDA